MRRRRFDLAIIACLAALAWLPSAAAVAPGAEPPVRSVTDVDRQLHDLNGQRVLVHGWIVGCSVPAWWSCGIAPAPGDRQHALSIAGADTIIDRRFRGLDGAEVVLDATADETCRVGICTDRASVLTVSTFNIIKRGAKF